MKIVGWFKKVLSFFKNNKKILQTVVLAAIGMLSIYSWTLPISDNFCKLSLLQRALVVISTQCGIAFLVFMIIATIRNAKKDKKYLMDLFYISPIAVIEAIGVCMLFDHKMWGYQSAFAGLALIYILFVEAFASLRTLFNKTFGKENTPVILISFAIVSLFLAVVSETAGIAEPANICYKICLGIAYLIATALFTDKYLYRPKKDSHTISHIIGIVSWGSLITITFPFYVQWCGLTGTDFDAFVSVYAAVIGGGITLAGVAWTIKDANDKRKEDLQRIEDERKEEERLKYRPFTNVFAGKYEGEMSDIKVAQWLNDSSAISKSKTDILVVENKINSCYFANIDFSHFYVWGLKINGNSTTFETVRLIRKDRYFLLNFAKKPIYTEKPISKISLILEDLLENLYELPLDYQIEPKDNSYTIVGNDPSKFIGKAKPEEKQ